MRHIILLTDFSETARHAAAYALNMFEGRNVRFYLFHAYDVEFSGSPYVMRVKEEMAEESRKSLKRELAALHSDFPNSRIEVASRFGPLVDVLIKEVEGGHIDPDLLVMGCRGESALENFLLGSNAFDVIKHVHLPILAIPRNAPLQTPQKMVFATDLKTIDQDMARPLFDLVSSFESELLFVNVMEDDYINRLDAEEKIAEFFPGVQLSFYFLEDADVCNSVCSFTEAQAGDMVVLVRHNYSFFERVFHPSITKKMVLHPQFPMFILHAR
ncbi:universal stress protein [Geofilum rubicundum]|nr:universal stress protein [Geofilum rubicundum]